jgi:hypothetical protein
VKVTSFYCHAARLAYSRGSNSSRLEPADAREAVLAAVARLRAGTTAG